MNGSAEAVFDDVVVDAETYTLNRVEVGCGGERGKAVGCAFLMMTVLQRARTRARARARVCMCMCVWRETETDRGEQQFRFHRVLNSVSLTLESGVLTITPRHFIKQLVCFNSL